MSNSDVRQALLDDDSPCRPLNNVHVVDVAISDLLDLWRRLVSICSPFDIPLWPWPSGMQPTAALIAIQRKQLLNFFKLRSLTRWVSIECGKLC